MRITTGLELNKPKFDVMLKGLLHGYKPAKGIAFATGGYNLIIVGTTQDGVTATVKNILKGECPENILCIGADYVFGDNWQVDLHGFIIYLPELRFVSDSGMSQILYSLEKIHKAMTEESDVQTYYGPGIMQHIYDHQFTRWLANDAAFHAFDYNRPPTENKPFIFTAKLFAEYGPLYRQGQNMLHQETYPILFPTIKANCVVFDIDLAQYADEELAYILSRCQSVNPNLRRYVHSDLAKRQFEWRKWILDTQFGGFLDREFDDRDGNRDVLTVTPPRKVVDTLTELEGKGVPSSLLPHQVAQAASASPTGGRTVMHLELPADATLADVGDMAASFMAADEKQPVDTDTPK